MPRAFLLPLFPDRAVLWLSASRSVEASFVRAGERVAFYPVADRADGRSGATPTRQGGWLDTGEAAAFRACLLTASVLANGVGLFAVLVLLVMMLVRGDVAPYAMALLGASLVMARCAQDVLPRALAAGRPPCPPRAELEGGAP